MYSSTDLKSVLAITFPVFSASVPYRRRIHKSASLACKIAYSKNDARDILWALTGRELYWMLVVDKGWISACYQEWLTDSITVALLKPKVKAQPPKKILRRDAKTPR